MLFGLVDWLFDRLFVCEFVRVFDWLVVCLFVLRCCVLRWFVLLTKKLQQLCQYTVSPTYISHCHCAIMALAAALDIHGYVQECIVYLAA